MGIQKLGTTPSIKTTRSMIRRNQFIAPVPFVTMVLDDDDLAEDSESTVLSLPPVALSSVPGLGSLEKVTKMFLQPIPAFTFSTLMRLNRFLNVLDQNGHVLFCAGENIDYGSSCWRGVQRRYCMYVFSPEGDLLFTVERQRLRCCSRAPPTQEAVSANAFHTHERELAQTLVHLSGGEFLGRIRKVGSRLKLIYVIDERGQPDSLLLKGSICGGMCGSVSLGSPRFGIQDQQNFDVGHIDNSGISPEVIKTSGRSKCLGASFSPGMTPVSKAMILAMTFELDITHFRCACSCESFVYFLIFVWVILLLSTTVFFGMFQDKIMGMVSD